MFYQVGLPIFRFAPDGNQGYGFVSISRKFLRRIQKGFNVGNLLILPESRGKRRSFPSLVLLRRLNSLLQGVLVNLLYSLSFKVHFYLENLFDQIDKIKKFKIYF